MQNIPLLILHHARGLGRKGINQLLGVYDSAENVLQKGLKGNILFNRWEVGDWQLDLKQAQHAGVRIITFQDPEYPPSLLKLPDFPYIIYVQGALTPQDSRGIALIGTRTATIYGTQTAREMAKELARAGVTVVSGLARGIDTAAHEGALDAYGRTIAIIGSGLSHLYPKENTKLAEKITTSGAVISEYPMATQPAKGLFPRRNRLISGISLGVCLIESPKAGGGMLTMEMALQQQKPRFAVPGRIDWPTYQGNHLLIKENKAHLVENGYDVLKHLNIAYNKLVKDKKLIHLTSEEQALLDKLPNEEKSIDALVLLTQLPIMQLNVLLTRLVLKKVVKELPGKLYKK